MDELGKTLIKDINKNFKTNIPITDETTEIIKEIVTDNLNALEYGYCSDCEERRGEPMINEGYY